MTQHAPLIIDIAGLSLSKADRRRLKHPLTGGIILFGRNWKDRQQLGKLCADIKSVRQDLLICVDHEGGRVQRFRTDSLTHLPPMRALGAQWQRDQLAATNAATACGYVLGAELRACGVDFSFTPVLDLDHQEEAPTQAGSLAASRKAGMAGRGRSGASLSSIIGDRAFGRDPRVVSLLAKSLMHGLLQSGMRNCGKHFPGHGFVRADSHIDIPVDTRSLKAILSDDAAPYEWLNTTLTSVMPAHVIYTKVDTRPAGFSSKWLNFILRSQLGFGGAIFSDDLSMAGARLIDGVEVSYTEAAVAALNAGCDMVLLCNQSEGEGKPVDELLDGMAEMLLKGQWEALEASELRRLALLPQQPALEWDELMVEPAYMHALGLIA
ncbi:MAG: glycoside hydrolase, family 3 domain protein [Polaromonas sp.]|nr:glycoside hydrolase, family 3 domain protein [Polaromonas sp.]